MAPALGLGLIQAWSVVYLAAMLVFNDAQTEFQRIERKEGQSESGEPPHQETAEKAKNPTGPNGLISQTSKAGPRDRRGNCRTSHIPSLGAP